MKLKLIYLACLTLALSWLAATRIHAQDVRAEGVQTNAPKADADPAAGVKKRLGQLKTQLKDLRAKPYAPRPGETVGLNPQPEPPGKARSGKLNSKGDEVSLNPQPEPPGVTRPGDAVALNPQPEPPGSVVDILRKMRSSLATIEADLKKLSLGADVGAGFRVKLNDAQASLNRYEKAGDQKSSNAALNEFSRALQALSKLSESYVK